MIARDDRSEVKHGAGEVEEPIGNEMEYRELSEGLLWGEQPGLKMTKPDRKKVVWRVVSVEEEPIMAKGDDLREKLVGFVVSVMDLCDQLPKTTAGQHIADQLLRRGTSPAPHYAEARGAESSRDFVHKELNEIEVSPGG